MLKRNFLLIGLTFFSVLIAQEETNSQNNDTIQLSEMQVLAELPITSEKISKNTIQEKNLGQDLPVLLKNATSVVTTSDAGNGIGYTSLRVRGIAQGQINVTFNGVPVNDSESHGVFWVDFPDISSSTNGILIQRGVGTSSNGAAAFGGSVNLETQKDENQNFLNGMISYGSFNTQKYSVNAGTGDFGNGKWNFDTRISYLNTDGYVDRASSNLYSGALNLRYKPNENSEFHVMNIFGHEKTYQSWYGIDGTTLENNRTFNPAGAIWDDNYTQILGFYDEQVDNYDQNHLHAYWTQKWSEKWKSKSTLHWTRGYGYYQEYIQNANLSDYHFDSELVSDLAQRQYLDNHFYGGIINLEGKNLGDFDFFFGAAVNQYIGGHYGTVEEVFDANLSSNENFYENKSTKTEFSTFAKALYALGNFELFGDVQLRTISYHADYENNGENPIKDFSPFDFNWTFLNPKAGINYRLPQSKFYASYGLTHREPTRSDILDNPTEVKPETLHDFELGYRTNKFLNFGINGYYMYYLDQLVLTGQRDDVGNPIRENVGESYRAGIELDASKSFWNEKFNFFGNLNLSDNKNLNYFETNDDGTLVEHGDTSISFTPEIITSFGVDFYPIENLKFNLTNKYVGKQYVTNTELNNGYLNDYFVSDFLAKYNLNLKQTKVQITLLINNLWDRMYANNGYYYGETYYFPQAGRNFLAGVQFEL